MRTLVGLSDSHDNLKVDDKLLGDMRVTLTQILFRINQYSQASSSTHPR